MEGGIRMLKELAMWDELINYWGISEETLRLVTNIAGYNERVLRDVLFEISGGENEFMFEQGENDEWEEF